MILEQEILELLQSDDLVAIGDRAHIMRIQLNPEGIVSYTTAPQRDPAITAEITLTGAADDLLTLLALREAIGFRSFLVRAAKGLTAVEYLRSLAIARLVIDHIPNLEIDSERFDLKVCQVALRFGANDLGLVAAKHSEEQYRRLIREAGFLPKKRDAAYLTYSLL